MSKIELPNITGGNNLSTLNNNFQKIEDALNEEVLYRKGYAGEPNEMQTNLDMNGNRILNISIGSEPNDLATRGYVDQEIAEVIDYVDQEIAEERSYADQNFNEINSTLIQKYDKAGGPISGDIQMNNHNITGINNVGAFKVSTNILEINGIPVTPSSIIVDPYNGTREALRRSYAESGYELVDGSFELGGTITTASQVLLHEAGGKAYSYNGTLPHTVASGSSPSSEPLMWTDRSGELLKHVFDGLVPYGPTDPVDWYYGGPQIRRKLVSTEDMNIFIDPAVGIDTNPGTQALPIKTLKEAVQRLPQQIYHKIRVYLLDGTYPAEDCIRLFNYYVTSRGRAGLRFVGHIATLDGEAHPIYPDTNPDAVVLLGFEHMTSGINGTEELYFAGITFKNGWYEGYDSSSIFVSCKFTGGQRSAGYSTYHAISGHYCDMHFTSCDFSDLAQIGSLTNFANVTFENCTLSGLHTTSDASLPGMPLFVSDRSVVYVRNSPQLLQTGPGGKSSTTTGGLIFDFLYSPMGYSAIRRSSPDRDESLYLLGHDGGALGSGRGAGIELNGVLHPTAPGRATVEFSGNQAESRFRVVHDIGGTPVEVLGVSRYGEMTAKSNILFSSQQRQLNTHLQDGQATLYTNPTSGDVFLVSKLGGVMKYVRLLEYATAPILP